MAGRIVRLGSGMAQRELVARIEASLPMHGQECAKEDLLCLTCRHGRRRPVATIGSQRFLDPLDRFFGVIKLQSLLVFDHRNCYFLMIVFWYHFNQAVYDLLRKSRFINKLRLMLCKSFRSTIHKLTYSTTGSTMNSGARHSIWYW